MMTLLIICSVIIVGLIFYLRSSDTDHRYKVIYNHGPNHSRDDYKENVADGVKFIKILVEQYSKVIDREVHGKFKGEFQLLKKDSVGAKLVISSFGESLIYIFPNTQNLIIVDCIDFPVQATLAIGSIDLNEPIKVVDLSKLELKIPHSDAVKAYNAEDSRIIIGEGYGGILFAGTGQVNFNGCGKLFSLPRKVVVGLGIMNTIAFRNAYGRGGYYEFKLKGPLLISSENTFDWTFKLAKKIGIEVAELEIKNLLTTSEFFKLSLADKKLRPKAENIIQKKERSEKDKSYPYPLWEVKKDIVELKEDAKQIGIDSSYVDELLKEPSLKAVDGTLFVYYPNAKGFMLQWSLMNIFIFIILTFLILTKYGDTPLLVLIMRAFSIIGTNLSIIMLITIANGWVFSKKPESLAFTYWIIPSILYFLCIAYYLVIVNSARYSQGLHMKKGSNRKRR